MEKEATKKIIDKVLLDNKLKILYNMSTSGDFAVKQCVNDRGENFILKVRQRKSEKLRQQFINEILINIFLGEAGCDNFCHKVVSYDIGNEPEYLLYKMVEGNPLNGYYFSIGKRNSNDFNPKKIVDLILFIQNRGREFENFNEKISLDKCGYRWAKRYLLKHETVYNKYFGSETFFKAKQLIEYNKDRLNKDFALSHGDLNPKNVLAKKDGNLTFIDWTDVRLDNPLSDVARLYLASWNLRGRQGELKKEALKRIIDSRRLFHLNIIVLMGNFLKILDDSSVGMEGDYKKGFISGETKIKLIEQVSKARENAIIIFRESLDYLDNLLLEGRDFEKIVNDFSNRKFILKFLNKNKKKLDIDNEIAEVELNIHHRRCNEQSKRLIVTYNFTDGEKEKKYTAKIRIFKGNNFAHKSWFMSNLIWESIRADNKYIARPIYYFHEYGLFIYETASGKSLGEILKKNNLSDAEKSERIVLATKYLAELHKIDISGIEKRKFLLSNSVFTHINFLEEFIKWGRENYEIRIKEAIKKARKEAKNFSTIKKTLIHGDFQIENFIFNGMDMKLIDFDDSEINDPLIDVGNFLVQMFYGGIMGRGTDKFRKIFLEEYIKANDKLDKRFINERLNLYIVIAKLKNISQKVIKKGFMSNDDYAAIEWELFRIKRRLDNMSGDPVKFFKV